MCQETQHDLLIGYLAIFIMVNVFMKTQEFTEGKIKPAFM